MNQTGSMGGDTRLSDNGEQYAMVLADFIAAQADAGQSRLAVWCSPMKRAVQTARAVSLPETVAGGFRVCGVGGVRLSGEGGGRGYSFRSSKEPKGTSKQRYVQTVWHEKVSVCPRRTRNITVLTSPKS